MERNQGSSNRDGRKRALAFSILAIVVLFVVILGATYAAFQYTKKVKKKMKLQLDMLLLYITRLVMEYLLLMHFPRVIQKVS